MASLLSITKVSFGIRFGPTYGFLVGDVMDEVLGADGTPFGPDFFPMTQATTYLHKMSNNETGNNLSVSPTDILLIWNLPPASEREEASDTKQVARMAEQFERFIAAPARDIGGARGVIRFGCLFELKECSAELARPLTKHYILDEVDGVRDMVMRFTRRIATEEGFLHKGVSNYKNIIHTLTQGDDGLSFINMDYQQIFEPALDTARWKKEGFAAFVDEGIGYLEGAFAKWLKGLLRATKAA
jgi:hypothetical protein